MPGAPGKIRSADLDYEAKKKIDRLEREPTSVVVVKKKQNKNKK
jgi:hypothetical protein